MEIKKYIPNTLTLINLFSGCLLVYFALYIGLVDIKDPSEYTELFMILLGISLVADLLDGMVARWLKVSSPIGLQLDSLADLITFGLFPGFLMCKMLNDFSGPITRMYAPIAFFGLLITLFSALRLAKFNVDATQTSYFKGLATPANALLIFGVYLYIYDLPIQILDKYGLNILISITVISSLLLVSNIPLFSFKIKSFNIKNILPQLLLLIIAIILLLIMGLKSLPIIILVYIILSIIFKKYFVHAST